MIRFWRNLAKKDTGSVRSAKYEIKREKCWDGQPAGQSEILVNNYKYRIFQLLKMKFVELKRGDSSFCR